jgi:hypothetical protein
MIASTDGEHNMQITNTYTDDKMPCVEFNHNGHKFELTWTNANLIACLELVQDGAIELTAALKKYPTILAIINNPTDENHPDFDQVNDAGQYEYCTSVGYMTVA